jgi:hypothetical protein
MSGETHLLYNLTINEVSSVDLGAGEGVQVMLMKSGSMPELPEEVIKYLKRSFSTDDRKKAASSGAALPDGSFPIENTSDLHNAIQAIGRAKNPAEAKAHIISRAKALGATSALPDTWTKRLDIEHKSGGKVVIEHDPEKGEVTVDTGEVSKSWLDKVGFTKAVAALGKTWVGILGDASVVDKDGAVTKATTDFVEHIEKTAPAALAEVLIKQHEGDTMTPEEIKKLTDAAVAKALEPLQLEIAKRDDEISLLKLAPTEIAFVAAQNMGDVAKVAFAKMSAADKAKAMKAAEDAEENDPVKKELLILRKQVADLTATDLEKAFTKRALDLGLPETFGKTLQAAHGGDKTAVTKLEEQIAALHKQVEGAGLFSELGNTGGAGNANVGKAYDQLVALGKSLREKNPTEFGKMSDAQMFAKVYDDPANAALVAKSKLNQ